MTTYGRRPIEVHPTAGRSFKTQLGEVMYYLYLPVKMPGNSLVRLPDNVFRCWEIINAARHDAQVRCGVDVFNSYIYLTARKGWASPDNPLNRPGWHCDGFGTDDLNYVYWRGPGTRFACGEVTGISEDHRVSMEQFESVARVAEIVTYPEQTLLRLDPFVIHATPLIDPPGCMREYIKVSISKNRYNLLNNSHNYLFDYDWPLHEREEVRNDTSRAQQDGVS